MVGRTEGAGPGGLFEESMDRLGTGVLVTEPETGRILFMNRALREAFGAVCPEGRFCWQVLQTGMTGPCPFCPARRLDPARPGEVRVREARNTRNGRIYESASSLLRWRDGSLAHFQSVTDVTELRRLSRAADYDELTGILNRRAGKAVLGAFLEAGRPFALCMLDVNDLKGVNDTRGHQAGDALLVRVTEAVRAELGPEDCLFRLSGDEFVALMAGADRAAAGLRMKRALAALRTTPEEDDRFCYGVAEAQPNARRTEAGLLSDADADLYVRKRRVHIRRAAERLARQAQSGGGEDFHYDHRLLYDALIQSTDDYLYVCDMKTGTFRYPQAMVEEFGLPGQVVENAAAVWGAKVHEHDKAAFLEANQDIADGRTDSHCVEYRAQNRKGEWLWMRCRGHLERDENGEPSLFAGFITNLGRKNQVDQLTGLSNRLTFEEECLRLLEAGDVTLMIFDIDELNRVNGLYDRSFGDAVIRIVSQRIRSLLPPSAQVFRLDGDEFGVLFRGAAEGAAKTLFRSVQDAFAAQQTYEGKKFFCTLSCGCAVGRGGETDYLGLVKRAHCALDCAKRGGKDRLEVFTPELLGPAERELELVELLRESVEQGFTGFRVYCQPVFLPDRSLLGAEALVRWSCGKYGDVPPGDFIPLAEESGLIGRLGRWVYREALGQCALFLRDKPDFWISVNLSLRQLEEPDLPDYLLDTAAACGVDPSQIVLELTESCLAANAERLSGLLEQLRRGGFRIAMDDFGTGYSSLGLLKTAPIDIVKLDQMFVRGIRESAFDRAFIRLTAELCRTVGIQVCLEGVETEEAYAVAASLGVDYLQGFLLGRPCGPREFAEKFLKGETS